MSAEERTLERIEANVLTVMLTRLGSIADALAEKNIGSERVENLAILAVEQGRKRAPNYFRVPPMLSPSQRAEWQERQEAAVDEAEAKFAGIINHIVALRDGAEEEDE